MCPKRFDFISPDMNCTEDPHDQTSSLQSSVEKFIEENDHMETVNEVSVFYRDLNSKQWFGINENKNFAPGSLLKLPLAIAYYKYSEIDAHVFEKKYMYQFDKVRGNLNDLQNTKIENNLVPGEEYSLYDLIFSMLKDSDNNVVPIIEQELNSVFLDKVNVDLGVYVPTSGGVEQDFVSVKTYGAIFRALYNASYLNQASSNEILSILSRSAFKEGIVADLPTTVTVAHKFGERYVVDMRTQKKLSFELHDCGIVYAPKNPYILCVMTKGSEYEDLAKTIAGISQIVYKNY